MAKLFIAEQGTSRMVRFINTLRPADCHISELTTLEIRSAIRRRESAYEIARHDAAQAISDLEKVVKLYSVHVIDAALLRRVPDVIDSHRLRALDAIQLSTAFGLPQSDEQPLLFVAADKALLKAATNSGLLTLNPEDLPQP